METDGCREKKARKTDRVKGRKTEKKRKMKPESRGTTKKIERQRRHTKLYVLSRESFEIYSKRLGYPLVGGQRQLSLSEMGATKQP